MPPERPLEVRRLSAAICFLTMCAAGWRHGGIPGRILRITGYQVTQSLFAIGTGGWFGMGLCQGLPQKIPVVEKDFIFAAISEEMGGIFALCLLLICLGCFLQFMLIATPDAGGILQADRLWTGAGVHYPGVFNCRRGDQVHPFHGVTLPFVSYGGSSIFSTFILFGVIQGLYILKLNDEEEMEEG